MEGKEGHKGHGREDRDNAREEPENLGLLLLGWKNDEDQHVDGLNGRAGPVNGWHQEVVRRHERKPVPVHRTSYEAKQRPSHTRILTHDPWSWVFFFSFFCCDVDPSTWLQCYSSITVACFRELLGKHIISFSQNHTYLETFSLPSRKEAVEQSHNVRNAWEILCVPASYYSLECDPFHSQENFSTMLFIREIETCSQAWVLVSGGTGDQWRQLS